MPCYIGPETPTTPTKNWPYATSAYLICDTHEELWEARWHLALKPEWCQDPGKATEHFDLAPGKIKKLFQGNRPGLVKKFNGSRVSMREIADIIAAKKDRMRREAEGSEAGRSGSTPGGDGAEVPGGQGGDSHPAGG